MTGHYGLSPHCLAFVNDTWHKSGTSTNHIGAGSSIYVSLILRGRGFVNGDYIASTHVSRSESGIRDISANVSRVDIVSYTYIPGDLICRAWLRAIIMVIVFRIYTNVSHSPPSPPPTHPLA